MIKYKNNVTDLFGFSFDFQLRSRVLTTMTAIVLFLQMRSSISQHKPVSLVIVEAVFYGMIFYGFVFLVSVIVNTLSPLIRKDKVAFTEHNLEITETSLIDNSQTGHFEHRWSSIYRICRRFNLVLIYTQKNSAFFIPSRAFPSKEEANTFYQTVRNTWEANKRSA